MKPSGVQTVTVSEVMEEMKTLSEELSKRADSPAEEEPTLQLPTGLEVTVVTEPVDGDMLKKKRKVAVLIVLAAVTNLAMVTAFFSVMRIVIVVQGTRNDTRSLAEAFSQEFEEEVVATYTTTFGLFGIVSGVLITLFNYWVVAATGAVLSGLGCLIASFLDLQNQTAMAFVYGFLPGVGNNFLYTAALVAVLECFTEKRLLTVLLTTFVDFLVQLILRLILTLDESAYSTSWQVTLRIMSAAYCACVLASWGLVPLNLHMKGNSRESVRARITNTVGYQSVLRSPLLYQMAGVFFFTGLGETIPVDMSAHWWILAPLILLPAALLTMLVACCCCRKTSRKTSLLVTAVVGFMMGVLSLSVRGLSEIPYAVIFSILYGLGYGLRGPVMENLIPLVMGDKYLPLIVGCLTFAKGVGSIIGEKSSAAITKDFSRYDAPFYLSGLALITSAVMVVVIIRFVNRIGHESQSDEEGGTAQINQLLTTTAAKNNLSAPPNASQNNLVTSLSGSGPRSDHTAKDAVKPASVTQKERKEH